MIRSREGRGPSRVFAARTRGVSFAVALASTVLVSAAPGVLPSGAAKAATVSTAPWYDLPWLGTPKKVPAVIASEREVSVTVDGMLQNYKEYPKDPQNHDRELGWTPGLSLRASGVFDIARLHDLYAAVQGGFETGDVAYHGTWADRSGYGGPFESRTNQQTASGQVELGKAWLITPRLLLITAAQGGYGYWNRSVNSGWGVVPGGYDNRTYVQGGEERYRYAWGGGTAHLDYAVTPRLVAKLTGAVGETFQGRMDASNTPATFYLGDRLRLQGGAVADYRITQRLHVIADADYTQFGFGRSHNARAIGYETLYEPTSQTQQLRLGLGIGFGF